MTCGVALSSALNPSPPPHWRPPLRPRLPPPLAPLLFSLLGLVWVLFFVKFFIRTCLVFARTTMNPDYSSIVNRHWFFHFVFRHHTCGSCKCTLPSFEAASSPNVTRLRLSVKDSACEILNESASKVVINHSTPVNGSLRIIPETPIRKSHEVDDMWWRN